MKPSRLALTSLVPLLALAGPAAAAGRSEPPAPVDPQSYVLPQDMTWNDYRAIPGFDWADPSRRAPKELRAALILGDNSDRAFLATQPQGSDVVGNPRDAGSVPRAKVGQYYEDLLNKPQALNHGHTINEYWLEDSYGLIGIDMDNFGPYRMDRTEPEYGLAEYGQEVACPDGKTCDGDFDTELLTKSAADVTAAQVTGAGRDYDFRFLLHSGYDESGVWQELGEMRFPSMDEVSEPFGNPDGELPNYAPTRYQPWTSFYAARGIWSHAIPGVQATEGENDGMGVYAHEFSHILGILDNYGNPYASPVQRDYTGPWDMMSRGSFNGPGGNHNRYQIPPTQGASLGSQHMLRDKIRLGFVKPTEVMTVDRTALAATGPAFADVWAREIPLGVGTGRSGLHGMLINLSGGDKSAACTVDQDYRCDGGSYENYTVEVVDRMGSDSFTPDHGVLIAKNKTPEVLTPWKWVIDAHPQDIDEVDFTRADGTVEKVGKGDYRQLADSLFHAGTGPGVVSEWEDAGNRLHFYVLAARRDKEGVLSYRVAVRSLDGSGPGTRGLEVTPGDVETASPGQVAVYHHEVRNTGSVEDLVRLKATSPWGTTLTADVVDVPAGETVDVPVYVRVPAGATEPVALTLTATSETDPKATATRPSTVTPAPGAPPAADPGPTPTTPTSGPTPSDPAPAPHTSSTTTTATTTKTATPPPAGTPGGAGGAARLRLVVAGRSCVRSGKLRLRLKSPVPLARASVTTRGKRARTLEGAALTRPLRLRGLRGRSVTIRVRGRTAGGIVLTTARTFTACG